MPLGEPQAPLGHLARLGFALVGARDVDEVARSVVTDLRALPGVLRVGFALSEGGGRRLRFTASDRVGVGADLTWCHIDGYDDVPLTTVVRTADPLLVTRAQLDAEFGEYAAAQPAEAAALAAVPLPGVGSPIGGFVLLLEQEWAFDEGQRRLLEATARRVAEAVRRVRVTGPADPDAEDDDLDPTVSARLTLADDPRAAGMARRFLREFLLTRSDVPADLAETAQLCLSELVTNAIVHAGSRSELTATVEEQVLTVTVRDRGAAGHPAEIPPPLDADPLQVHGRGLQLVEALADRWGTERDALGTTVWFALELGGSRVSTSETG